jgi:hypothetical protein
MGYRMSRRNAASQTPAKRCAVYHETPAGQLILEPKNSSGKTHILISRQLYGLHAL